MAQVSFARLEALRGATDVKPHKPYCRKYGDQSDFGAQTKFGRVHLPANVAFSRAPQRVGCNALLAAQRLSPRYKVWP
jgi:hypothetical protein